MLPVWRRIAALVALVAAAAAVIAAVLGLLGNPGRVILAGIAVLVASGAGWVAVTRRGGARLAALGVVVLSAAVLLWALLTSKHHLLLALAVVLLVAVSVATARAALGLRGGKAAPGPPAGTRTGAARHGVLIMNLHSGGGKAERFHLVDEATRRGIEPIVLRRGDDLRQLCEDAIARGADVIGMAGGDGSQALVATAVAAHGASLVCVPAGTRNHFALDLGLDRDDVLGALDAFGAAVERRVDLARVGDRVFVNNVSLGTYAELVQSPDYRDAKRATTERMLPELLGPDGHPPELAFQGPDGSVHSSAQVIQISNNPYSLAVRGGFGTRPRLDTGQLGIVAAEVHSPAEAAELVALEVSGRMRKFRGLAEWASPSFRVDSPGPIAAGVDGEALTLDPPLEFRSLPGALRVRLPLSAPGRSPAAAVPPISRTLHGLVAAVGGHPFDATAA